MPRPRFAKLAPETRRAILDAAAAEFAERGFHEASYNAIIERTGLSKGSFYYYFDDKADLFFTTLEDAMATASAGLGGLWLGELDERPFWDQVAGLIREVYGRAAAHPTAVMLAKASQGAWTASDPRVRAFEAAVVARTRIILEAGQRVGAVRDDLPLELLAAAVSGVGEAVDRYLLASLPEDVAPTAEDAEAGVALGVDLMRRLAEP